MNRLFVLLSLLLCASLTFACSDDSDNRSGEHSGDHSGDQCNCMGAFCDNNVHYSWTGCSYETSNSIEQKICDSSRMCVPYDGCVTKCTLDSECAAENKVCGTKLGLCVEADENHQPKDSEIERINQQNRDSTKSCK